MPHRIIEGKDGKYELRWGYGTLCKARALSFEGMDKAEIAKLAAMTDIVDSENREEKLKALEDANIDVMTYTRIQEERSVEMIFLFLKATPEGESVTMDYIENELDPEDGVKIKKEITAIMRDFAKKEREDEKKSDVQPAVISQESQ